MNEIFNSNRFGKYFLYDLRNAKNSFWLSLIITGCLPVIVFVVGEMIARFTTGAFVNLGYGAQIPALLTAFMIVTLTFPVKAYGRITDKKAGSSWLMIPASSFEKWLSLILVTCVVLPLCFITILFLADGFVHLCFPGNWPEPALIKVGSLNQMFLDQTDGIVSFNFPALLFVSWAENILVFTLGAVVFKKAKVGKTFLALWVFGMVLSWLTMAIFGVTHITPGDLNIIGDDPDIPKLLSNFNLIISLILTLFIGGCAAGIFYRIKTLKH